MFVGASSSQPHHQARGGQSGVNVKQPSKPLADPEGILADTHARGGQTCVNPKRLRDPLTNPEGILAGDDRLAKALKASHRMGGAGSSSSSSACLR